MTSMYDVEPLIVIQTKRFINGKVNYEGNLAKETTRVDVPPNMVGLYVAETTLNNQKEIKMYTNIIIKFTKILTMFGTIHSHES